MKLLIVNDWGVFPKKGLLGGGAENRIKMLVDELLNSGAMNAIHVIHNEKYEQSSFSDKVFYHPCDSKKLFSSYHLANEVIEKYDINILQLHNALSLRPFSILSAKKYRIPSIWVAHDFWLLCGMRSFINPYKTKNVSLCHKIEFLKCLKCIGWKSYLRLKYFRFVLNKADCGIAPGQFVKQVFEKHKILNNKWKIVKPWIDTNFSSNKESLPRKDILFVGSLLEYKGAWVAVEALKYIVKEIPDIKLKIAGQNQDDIYAEEIKKIAKQEGVLNNLEFLGVMSKSQLDREYRESAVFVFPTVCQELFGLVWAEAMACGCPVVASDTGGVSEYVKNHGVLFQPRDSKILAESIIKILKNSPSADILNASKEYILENFSVKKSAGEMLKIYEEFLRNTHHFSGDIKDSYARK